MTFNEGKEIQVSERGLTAFKGLGVRVEKATRIPSLFSTSGHDKDKDWHPRREKIAICVNSMRPVSELSDLNLIYVDVLDEPETPEVIAERAAFEEQVPHNFSSHLCGIHAAKEPNDAITYVAANSSEDGEYMYFGGVLVEIAIWGKVLEGTSGYRAEKAYPLCLYLPTHIAEGELGQSLVSIYGVAIKTQEEAPEIIGSLHRKQSRSRTFRITQGDINVAPHIANIIEQGGEVVVNPISMTGINTLRSTVGLPEGYFGANG